MYKFNNGYGAIICDGCGVIMAMGTDCDPLIGKPNYCRSSCEKLARFDELTAKHASNSPNMTVTDNVRSHNTKKRSVQDVHQIGSKLHQRKGKK